MPLKQTSKLANPTVRRLGFGTDLYKILDIRLIPANQEYDPETGEVTAVDRDREMLEISARNPRGEPAEYEIGLRELVQYLAPELFGNSPAPEPDEEPEPEEESENETLPEPCTTSRRKVSNPKQTYDEWVDELFKWKARQLASRRR